MTLHCDSCGNSLGTYLYGPGGVEEKAIIYGKYNHRLPDIVCKVCFRSGFSLNNPKDPIRVYGKKYEKYPPDLYTPTTASFKENHES